jgi:hypothetical protein
VRLALAMNDRVKAIPRHHESYSDVIIRVVRAEGRIARRLFRLKRPASAEMLKRPALIEPAPI